MRTRRRRHGTTDAGSGRSSVPPGYYTSPTPGNGRVRRVNPAAVDGRRSCARNGAGAQRVGGGSSRDRRSNAPRVYGGVLRHRMPWTVGAGGCSRTWSTSPKLSTARASSAPASACRAAFSSSSASSPWYIAFGQLWMIPHYGHKNLLISRKPSTTGRLYRKHERPTPWDFIPCPPARRIFCGQHVRVVQRRLVHCPGVAGAECGHIFFQLIALADALKEYEASPLSEVRHEQGGHKQPHQPSDRQPRHRSPPPESCAWRAGLSRSKCHQTATATQARALLTLPRRRAIAASPLRFLPACGAVAQLGER